MPSLFQDLRFGLRLLRRSPGFATAAAVTLALGIGSTTALFSAAGAVILRPLRFPESHRVMTVLAAYNSGAFEPMDSLYADWRDRQQCFELFAAAFTTTRILRMAESAREVPIAQVSADFFPLTGWQPPLGRLFTREEDQSGHDGVALLDHDFWSREYAASPAVLGQTFSLNNSRFTVIGVLPRGARFPGFGRRDIWIPLAARSRPEGGGTGGTLVVGRLRPGITREAAQAEMDAVTSRIQLERPRFKVLPAVVAPFREWLAGRVRTTFFVLAGAAAFLLLIACANLANLLLARGAARRREMSIRVSLGAGRARLAAQIVTENLLLTSIGGLAGMILAAVAVRAVPAIRAIEIPRAEEVAIDPLFLLTGLAISLASALLFGFAPALEAWRSDLLAGLNRGDGRLSGRRFRDVLVASQIALALILLTGAGLMSNTLLRMLHIDLGLVRSGVFTVQPSYTPAFTERAARAQYLRELAGRVARMPGVASVSVANAPPLKGGIGGYPLRNIRDGVSNQVDALGRDVDPGYFRTVGIPLLAGRDFEPADASRKPVPLILNQSAARVLFGSGDPIGKLVECTQKRIGGMQVGGIVGDARVLGIARIPGPQAFAPLMGGWGSAAVVVVRAGVPPGGLAALIRTEVRGLDPGSPAPEITSLDDTFDDQVAKPRFYTALLSSFAALGLILAAVGVYGVIAWTVSRRTQEFGIRIALGAQPSDLVRMVVLAGARVIAAGVILGLAGAWVAVRLLESLLFEMQPHDPLTFAVTTALLLATALAACWFAARRAAAVDLNLSLRRD